MGNDTIPTQLAGAKPSTSKAYFEGACPLESMYLDAERIGETAFGLACSQAYNKEVQAAFYALGQLAESLADRGRLEGDRLQQIADAGKEAGR